MIEKEKVARPEGLEPPTLCLEGRRSFQLSYGRVSTHFNGETAGRRGNFQ
jgi:hypothetical protein